jgi:radical SAM superfamily enzyme YgiQ (UPF0313 family)
VYANRVKEAFPDLPVIVGGLEASLRRFAHYDYWEDKVRRPVLFAAKADLLIYGMGETAVRAVAERLKRGVPIKELTDIRGTACVAEDESACRFSAVECASYEEVSSNKQKYAEANMLQYEEHDPIRVRLSFSAAGAGSLSLIRRRSP